jgi:hypothetical protein
MKTPLLALLVVTIFESAAIASPPVPAAPPSLTAAPVSTRSDLVFEDRMALDKVRADVAQGRSKYAWSLATLRTQADRAVTRPIDPVTNKTTTPPSGDKRDYISIAPYWWPDPAKPDGLPWVRRDGQVNPATRGNHTDFERLSAMFDDVHTLAIAYHVTQDRRYGDRLTRLLDSWFVDPESRVNPAVNFGQYVPGGGTGRPAGLIEWHDVTHVVTAAQIAKQDGLWPTSKQAALDLWLSQHLDFLMNSEMMRGTRGGLGNPSTWHDVMLVGLLLYFNRDAEAKAIAEMAKSQRIDKPISPEGVQTIEVKRTKSVNYSRLNLAGLIELGVLARKVDVDLLDYESADGRSIKKAMIFLGDFANDPAKVWPYQQITNGGARGAIESVLTPALVRFELKSGIRVLNDPPRQAALEKMGASTRIAFAIPD